MGQAHLRAQLIRRRVLLSLEESTGKFLRRYTFVRPLSIAHEQGTTVIHITLLRQQLLLGLPELLVFRLRVL